MSVAQILYEATKQDSTESPIQYYVIEVYIFVTGLY